MSGYGVFMTHSELIRMDALFARGLRDRLGLGSVAVVHGKRDRAAAEAEQAFDRVVDVVERFEPTGAERRVAANLARLAELEREGGEATLYQDIYQDRWLLGRFDQPFLADYLAHGTGVLQEVLAGDVRLVMGEMTMALYRTARRLALGRAPFLYPMNARFFWRFYFEDDLELGWRRCCQTYAAFRRDGIPDGPRREAEAALAAIVEKQIPHAAFSVMRRFASAGAEPLHAKLQRQRIANHVAYWRQDFPERRRNPRIQMPPWEMSPLGMVTRWAREHRNLRFLRAHSLRNLPEEQAFCSYFLHYQPEYTVEGVGFPVVDQAALVRTIAQSLPVEMLLLVKEQPFMAGCRPEAFYRALLALPNVRLVAEDANSRELIRRSRCVFSISGTSALEALFFGIPAVLFSRVFHSGFDGITRVLDLYSLPDRVRKLLAQGPRDTRESSLAALAAMYTESYDGLLMTEIADPSLVLNEANAVALGTGLARELARRDEEGTTDC